MSKKPQTNAGDEEAIAAAKRQEERTAQRAADDLKAVLATRQGRRFFWNLIATTGLLSQSFTGNSTTFFNEGRRSIGLELWRQMEDVAPEAYALMVQEARDDSI